MTNPPLDASIPTLTEIIDPAPGFMDEPDQPVEATPAAPVEALADAPGTPSPEIPPEVPAAPPLPASEAAPGAEPRLELSPAQWHALEETLRERILLQLQNRVDFILEHRVRDSLADVLQTAVSSLADEIRAGLQNTLKEVIERAVAQELAKLQSGKRH